MYRNHLPLACGVTTMDAIDPQIPQPASEDWRPILGYEEIYEVSNRGRVRSLDRSVRHKNGVVRRYPSRVLVPIKNVMQKRNGFERSYYVFNLAKLGKVTKLLLHRLFAIAFIPNPLNLPEIDHVNGDSLDNRIENLNWVSSGENVRRSFHQGLRSRHRRGENSPLACLTNASAIEIYRRCQTESDEELALAFNVSKSAINNIRYKHRWKAVIEAANSQGIA